MRKEQVHKMIAYTSLKIICLIAMIEVVTFKLHGASKQKTQTNWESKYPLICRTLEACRCLFIVKLEGPCYHFAFFFVILLVK